MVRTTSNETYDVMFFYGLPWFLWGLSIAIILHADSFGVMKDLEFLVFHPLNMPY
jgi:hypothetical protein